MIRRILLTAVLGCLAVGTSMAAEVFINVAPPRPIVERRIPPPGPGYYWTPGYHRWDGRAYAWTPGAWVLPPRPHAVWVAPHYVHRGHGYVFVEGHWR